MFTYDFYRDCLSNLKEKGYKFIQFDDEDVQKDHAAYLRHDVDSDFWSTIPFGKIEKEIGVRSIFFFQPNNDFYNILSAACLSTIDKLNAMGHRIGLHIDAEMASDELELESQVESMYHYYNRYIPLTRIVSFHKPGPVVIEKGPAVKGFISTYEKRFFKDIMYFSDSDRRKFWEQGFLDAINSGENIQLLTHPFWWGPYEQSVYEAFNNYMKKVDLHYAKYFHKNFKTFEKALFWLEQNKDG